MKTRWLVLPFLFAVWPVDAAQVMKKVWFPDGVITWRTTNFSDGLFPGVPQAMDYLEQRTPLRISQSQENGALEVHLSHGAFNGWYGGETKGYRNAAKNNPQIRISFKNASSAADVRNTLLHEMGHALGFTHEFQRSDREQNEITVCFGCLLDPFNFDIVNSKQATILTPYDFESRFATGYGGVTPEPESPVGALLSAHDIDAIYRVFGKSLDADVKASDRFGVAVTTGDYDGDDTEDIAVASVETTDAGDRAAFVNFFKGVVTGPADDDTGTSYMPWFRQFVAIVSAKDEAVALASGDLKQRASSTTVEAGRDGIDEVVVGLPSAMSGEGLVLILTVNVKDRFLPNDQPWGGKGIFHTTTIRPSGVGLTADGDQKGFGRAVLVARLSLADSDDLVIGVPETTVVDGMNITRGSGMIVYLPGGETDAPIAIRNWSRNMSSRFGATLGTIPRLWVHGTKRLDALVVGAPGEDGADDTDVGAVYIYRVAVDDKGVPIAPGFARRLMEPGDGMRFGEALAGFVTNQGNHSWFPTYHLVVGSPGRALLEFAGGSVWLYDVSEAGLTTRVALREMPGAKAGAEFGAAIAVHGANCVSGQCARGGVNLAIGAPHASNSAGQVYRWEPWTDLDGALADSSPMLIATGTESAEYGAAITSIRETEGRGGFVIGAPDLLAVKGGAPIASGSAEVHLNKGYPAGWSSWRRLLSKMTTGDRRPDN